MEQLNKKVRAVRRRLLWLRFLSVTCTSLLWLMIAAAITLAVSRLIMPIEDEAAWQLYSWYTVIGLLALSIPMGLLSVVFGRVSLFRAAVATDIQLGLKERISSAFLLRGPRRPMEELLEADAVRAAAEIRPRRDFPFQAPRALRHLPLPLMALLLVGLLVEQRNLLASTQETLTEEQRLALQVEQEDNTEQAEQVEQLKSEIEEAMAHLSDPSDWEEMRRALDEIAENLRAPETSRIDELAAMSDLADEAAQRRDELERMFEQNRNFQADPSAQMTAGLQQAMQSGDSSKIQEALEELAEQMQDGEMSADEMEQLASELEQMAESMGGQESQTGQGLMQAAQAMRAAAAASPNGQGQEGMSQAMQAMSEAMNDLQDAGEQLAFAEALEADLNARRAELARNPNLRPSGQMCEACRSGMGQCQGGNCPGGGSGKMRSLAMNSGQWRPGETLNRRGNGTGGPGQGRGGNPPESENVNPTFRDEQLLSQHSAGEIIAEFKFKDGQQIAGESNVALSDALLGYEQEAERTLETEVIPAGYRNITREYFSTFTGSGRADDHDHELEAGDATTAP